VPTLTKEQAFKRAGGRRRYNERRQEEARARRDEVSRLLDLYGERRRGTLAKIAREMGVSRATITRDVRALTALRWALKNPAKAIRMLYGCSR
jgi:DNA invertase Pin-like site-specific DNA recombinase